jgi:hypothetical protein
VAVEDSYRADIAFASQALVTALQEAHALVSADSFGTELIELLHHAREAPWAANAGLPAAAERRNVWR